MLHTCTRVQALSALPRRLRAFHRARTAPLRGRRHRPDAARRQHLPDVNDPATRNAVAVRPLTARSLSLAGALHV